MIREIKRDAASGLVWLVGLLFLTGGNIWWFVQMGRTENVVGAVAAGVTFGLLILLWVGLFIVNPNEAKVLQLFGSYAGTVHTPGLRWANPFYTKRKISVRVRNFETGKLKVNDKRGTPIEIAAVVVWKVVDTAEALFEVDEFEDYIHVQSESAVRGMATDYPYDTYTDDEVSLTGHLGEIAERLQKEIQDRLEKAGIRVLEARISHLAYAPEIAGPMLQRQQASAIIAARQKIVEGAVGMVETALDMLSKQNIVRLDEERKAAMVSNLLVVLCSDRATTPVVNTGSLYT
ncbi:MAG TPA: SPFH domain-containing protein [Gemmatimonadales bacterium]|jgi:regulator of protease activity HflC (stomatin/prohibitin superfamily)